MSSMKQEAASPDTGSASLQNCEEGMSAVYKPLGTLPPVVLCDGSLGRDRALCPGSCS